LDDTLLSLLAGLPDDPMGAFVLADYLEEQNDPRGELLRLVYTLTRSVRVPGGRVRPEARLRQLLYEKNIRPITPLLELPLSKKVTLTLAWVPPGVFLMGSLARESGSASEKPRHEVTLTRGFWMGVYLVRQVEWQSVMRSNPSRAARGDDFPVDDISWEMAADFCQRASTKTKRTIRLPTEAEWEYACRAGSTTSYHFGNALTQAQSNYEGNKESGQEEEGTTPVGTYPPNGFGLFDMHGNLYEWVQDRYSATYYQVSPPTDPQGPDGPDGAHRLLRGGSWFYGPNSCRSAYRIECSANYGHYDQGFRVVCELPHH
jgi:formylglycine-generating enzyme required for sulfatase activity